MIRVMRIQVPASLDGQESPGGKETARMEVYFEALKNGETGKKRPEQAAYNLPDVRTELDRMFLSKCAYCETLLPKATGDIEHFRPKNAVELDSGERLLVDLGNGVKVETGYWWLAAEWDNLLYSCIPCNQPRRRGTEEDGELVPGGKGNRFPIVHEDNRAKNPGQLASEEAERLLINPCKENPADLLYVELDHTVEQWGMMLPRRLADGSADLRGSKTIEVFDLNNPSFVKRRKDKLRSINNRMRDFSRTLRDLNELAPGADSAELEAELLGRIEELVAYLEREKEDLLLARQAICPFLAERSLAADGDCES